MPDDPIETSKNTAALNDLTKAIKESEKGKGSKSEKGQSKKDTEYLKSINKTTEDQLAFLKESEEDKRQEAKKKGDGALSWLKGKLPSLPKIDAKSLPFVGLLGGIVSKGKSMLNLILHPFQAIQKLIGGIFKGIANFFATIANVLFKTIPNAIVGIIKGIKSFIKLIGSVVKTVLGVIKNVIGTVLNIIKKVIGTVFDIAKKIFGTVFNIIKKGFTAFFDIVKKIGSVIINIIGKALKALGKGIGAVLSGIGKGLMSFIPFLTFLMNPLAMAAFGVFVAGIIGLGFAAKLARKPIESLAKMIGGILVKAFESIVEVMKIMQPIMIKVFDSIDNIVNKISGVFIKFLDTIVEVFNILKGFSMKEAAAIAAVGAALIPLGAGFTALSIGLGLFTVALKAYQALVGKKGMSRGIFAPISDIVNSINKSFNISELKKASKIMRDVSSVLKDLRNSLLNFAAIKTLLLGKKVFKGITGLFSGGKGNIFDSITPLFEDFNEFINSKIIVDFDLDNLNKARAIAHGIGSFFRSLTNIKNIDKLKGTIADLKSVSKDSKGLIKDFSGSITVANEGNIELSTRTEELMGTSNSLLAGILSVLIEQYKVSGSPANIINEGSVYVSQAAGSAYAD